MGRRLDRPGARGLAQAGKLEASAKLKEEGGRHLRSSNGRVEVTDGPYAEAREVMGGYFTVEAADYDEAVEIARGCPPWRTGVGGARSSPAKAAASFRSALAKDCPKPVRWRLEERVRELEPA